MNNRGADYIKRLLNDKERFKKWKRNMLALSCVVVFITVYALTIPAVTLACDKEEHVHTTECYDENNDFYICKNNKQLKVDSIKIRKSKTGYESVKTIYICEDCSNCNYKSQCIKGNNSKIPLEKRTKKFETSKKFNRQRKEDLERIITDEGILLRMNRSIQAEGSFAQVKHDMNFKRFMCRGQKNVLAESILLAIAHNVNKLHNKIQYNRTGKHLFELKEA